MSFVYPIMDQRYEKMFIARAWAFDERAAIFYDITSLTGCRCNECIEWTIGEVKEFLKKGIITIQQEKTDDTRDVPINKHLKKSLCKYIEGKAEWLRMFPSPKHDREVLSLKQMGRLIKQIGKDIGYPYPLGTHTGRKTFGWKLKYEEGMDEEDIKDIYGHSTVKVTRKYTCIKREMVFNAVLSLRR